VLRFPLIHPPLLAALAAWLYANVGYIAPSS
jgi:hypothetical protein